MNRQQSIDLQRTQMRFDVTVYFHGDTQKVTYGNVEGAEVVYGCLRIRESYEQTIYIPIDPQQVRMIFVTRRPNTPEQE